MTERQAAPGDEDVLVLGDLNSYSREDPIDALTGGGLVNILAERVDAASRYSYVFDGAQGVLDHALATPGLARKVTGATEWHVSADEPDVFEYGNLEAFYAPNAYRSSNHDALRLGLNTRGRPSC